MALQNLPQTFRGRERSKRGYASRLLFGAKAEAQAHSQGLREAAYFGAPTEQVHEGRGMGFRALVNRRKWGGTNEHAVLVRSQAQDSNGGVAYSLSPIITDPLKAPARA